MRWSAVSVDLSVQSRFMHPVIVTLRSLARVASAAAFFRRSQARKPASSIGGHGAILCITTM